MKYAKHDRATPADIKERQRIAEGRTHAANCEPGPGNESFDRFARPTLAEVEATRDLVAGYLRELAAEFPPRLRATFWKLVGQACAAQEGVAEHREEEATRVRVNYAARQARQAPVVDIGQGASRQTWPHDYTESED